jgi:ABC-type nitrate/sulfonate/bicarbonate transport system substrate-binding protein
MNRNDALAAQAAMDRRRFMQLAGGAAAGVAFLSACGGGGSSKEPGGPASNAAGFSSNIDLIRTGYDNPNFSHHMADVVALEKGYLKAVGITKFDNKIINDSMAAVVGRGLDWTAVDTDVVIPAVVEKDVKLTFLGTRRDSEDMIFGLAPGVTLDELKAKRGYVSGGEVGTRNELLGKMMITDLGLDPKKDVRWVAMGGGSDTRLVSLINGQLLGSNLQIRHIPELEKAGGTIVYNKNRKIAQDGYTVQTSFLEKNRDAVVSYLYAIIQAKQFIKNLDNKDEVISMLEKHDFEFSADFKDAFSANVSNLSPDGGFEIAEMDLIWSELGSTGEANGDIEWRKALDLTPLWEAQEALDLPRRPATL